MKHGDRVSLLPSKIAGNSLCSHMIVLLSVWGCDGGPPAVLQVQLRKADDLESDFFEDVLVMHAECSGKGTISTDPNLVPGSNSAGNVVTIKGVYSGGECQGCTPLTLGTSSKT